MMPGSKGILLPTDAPDWRRVSGKLHFFQSILSYLPPHKKAYVINSEFDVINNFLIMLIPYAITTLEKTYFLIRILPHRNHTYEGKEIAGTDMD